MVMIHSSLSDAIKQSVSSALEGMAFSEAQRSANLINIDEELIWAKVAIKKPYKGMAVGVFPEALAYELSGNMFGMDEDELSVDIVKDALAELLNTIAGLFMAKIVEQDQVFELDVPETGQGTPESGCSECFEDNFSVDEKSFRFILCGKDILNMVLS